MTDQKTFGIIPGVGGLKGRATQVISKSHDLAGQEAKTPVAAAQEQLLEIFDMKLGDERMERVNVVLEDLVRASQQVTSPTTSTDEA